MAAARAGGRARSILLAGDPVLASACRPLVRSELP